MLLSSLEIFWCTLWQCLKHTSENRHKIEHQKSCIKFGDQKLNFFGVSGLNRHSMSCAYNNSYKLTINMSVSYQEYIKYPVSNWGGGGGWTSVDFFQRKKIQFCVNRTFFLISSSTKTFCCYWSSNFDKFAVTKNYFGAFPKKGILEYKVSLLLLVQQNVKTSFKGLIHE